MQRSSPNFTRITRITDLPLFLVLPCTVIFIDVRRYNTLVQMFRNKSYLSEVLQQHTHEQKKKLKLYKRSKIIRAFYHIRIL